jgi:hypothetical protein
MKNRFGQGILIVTVLLVSAPSFSQVNTEKMRTGATKPGFGGFVDGTVLLRKGNVDLLQVGGGLRLEYNAERIHQVFLLGNALFGENTGEVYINKAFTHLRWTGMWLDWFGTEVFTQVQQNQFIRLQLRTLAGVGVRLDLVEEKAVELVFGTGYMFEYEKLDIETSNPHARESQNHRWTNYLTIKLNLWKSFRVVNTFYVQPRFDAFGDFRILEDFALEVDLTKRLKLVLGLSLYYDSDPPAGIKGLDTTLHNKIRVMF